MVAGVIGTHKFVYDIWSDAVNIASRMELHGIANRIQVSAATHRHNPRALSAGAARDRRHQRKRPNGNLHSAWQVLTRPLRLKRGLSTCDRHSVFTLNSN